MNKFENKIFCFATSLLNVYKDDEKREDIPKLELATESEEDITEDFIAMLYAQMVVYKNLTGDIDVDIIGFTHMLNRLAFQKLLQTAEIKKQKGD